MLRRLTLNVLMAAMLALTGCEQSNDTAAEPTPSATQPQQQTGPSENQANSAQGQAQTTEHTQEHSAEQPEQNIKLLPLSDFKTVEWADLMPKEDLEALLNPPSYVTDVEDGSMEDQISNQMRNTIAAASDDRYQQALNSIDVVPEMNGKPIRIPGFIVPLEFNDDQTITQFFLVPFFGACIHVPPPPPNQIIYVNYPQGFKLDVLYNPIWVSGVLKTSLVENNMAVAAYSMEMHYQELYKE